MAYRINGEAVNDFLTTENPLILKKRDNERRGPGAPGRAGGSYFVSSFMNGS